MEKSNLCIELTTISCMEKLRCESEFTMIEKSGVTLKNQIHSFQLAIKNKQPWALYNSRVEVTGVLAPFVSIGVIDCVPAEFTMVGEIDDYYLGTSGVFPDVIRPYKGGLLLPPNAMKCLWVSVNPQKELPVGVHKVGFQVLDADGKLMGEAEYELEILDACIERSNIRKTNWMHYDCICNMHTVQPFTPAFYDIFDKYLSSYVHSGFNMLLTPLFTPPLDTYEGGERMTVQLVDVKKENGKYSFDFTKLRDFLRFVFECGVEYVEFSHLFTQWGAAHCPKIMATENGEYKKIFGWENDSCGEEYKAFLNAFLPGLVAFIKEENISEKCYFHITDEPHEKHMDRYKACREIVKNNIGNLLTLDAVSHFSYYEQGLLDILVSNIAFIDNFLKNNPNDLFAYYCCAPTNKYYTNRFLNMPLQRTRILGFQLYQTQVKGFLHWGFNFYNSGLSYSTINPYAVTNAGGAFPPGDGFIVYPADDGVNLSMRSEAIRMGFEDYDLLYTLEQKIGSERVHALLKEEGVVGYTEYPRDAVWHRDFVSKLKKMLVH